MEISRIGPGWNQENDESIFFRSLLVALGNPGRDLTIRRIYERAAPPPVLRETVLLFCKIPLALGIGGRCARIEIKMELVIEGLENVRRRAPLIRGVRKKDPIHI